MWFLKVTIDSTYLELHALAFVLGLMKHTECGLLKVNNSMYIEEWNLCLLTCSRCSLLT